MILLYVLLYITGYVAAYYLTRAVVLKEVQLGRRTIEDCRSWEAICMRGMISMFSWPMFFMALLIYVGLYIDSKKIFSKQGPKWL